MYKIVLLLELWTCNPAFQSHRQMIIWEFEVLFRQDWNLTFNINQTSLFWEWIVNTELPEMPKSKEFLEGQIISEFLEGINCKSLSYFCFFSCLDVLLISYIMWCHKMCFPPIDCLLRGRSVLFSVFYYGHGARMAFINVHLTCN